MVRRALVLVFLLTLSAPAVADEHPVFVGEIRDRATYTRYAKTVDADEMGKFLIDLSSDRILYFDVNLFNLHRDFVFKVVLQREMTPAEIKDYNRNYHADKPRFILGYLTHHLKDDTWDFSFWSGDLIRPDAIRRVRARLNATLFVPADKLRWRPDSTNQEGLLAELADLPSITNDRIYKDAPFQAFNSGTAVGKLTLVPADTPYESLTFARDEIVILQETYPDLPPVAGIVSTTFSTPLAHVNLRARAWGVPNAAIKGAGATYAALAGQTVTYEVKRTGYVLRAATPDEIEAHAARRADARKVVVPPADVATTELRPLDAMRAADARTYGSKAANLGAIVGAHLRNVNVPAGFGVPFSAYVAHMKRSGLDAEIARLVGDAAFADPAGRRAALEGLRARIVAAPLDPELLGAVAGKIEKDLGGAGVFVRSSTSAEDLPGFNGAGLYDTVPNVKGREALALAIKQVWASLWNLRAVEERDLYGIDQRAVYAGVLVQIGVDASAAGVLVTRNLFDPSDRNNYTINAKHGLGLRVVGGTTVPEQVLYNVRFPGAKVISRSDDRTMLVFDAAGGIREVETPGQGTPVLTEKRARDLSKAVKSFLRLFPGATSGLDVEWVLEGEKVWIVQARPMVTRD